MPRVVTIIDPTDHPPTDTTETRDPATKAITQIQSDYGAFTWTADIPRDDDGNRDGPITHTVTEN